MPRKARPKIRGVREPEELRSGSWRGWTWDARNGRKGPSRTWPTYAEAQSWMVLEQAKLDGVVSSDEPAAAAVVKALTPRRRAPLLAEDILVWAEEQGGNSNVRSTRRSNARMLAAHWPTQRVDEITRTDVERWNIAEERAGRSSSTRSVRLWVLRDYMQARVDDGLRDADPTARFSISRRSRKRESRTPTDAEVDRLMAAIAEGLRPAILLARDTGARLGEVVALRWRHIDLTGEYHDGTPSVLIGPTVLQADGSEQPWPKGKDRVTQPLSQRAVDALAVLKVRQNGQSDDRVFRSPLDPDKPLTYNQLDHRWRKARDAAKLTKPLPRWHDLRHGLGHDLYRRGAPPAAIQRVMRHKHLSTSQIYMPDVSLEDAARWMGIHQTDPHPPEGRRLRAVPDAEVPQADTG